MKYLFLSTAAAALAIGATAANAADLGVPEPVIDYSAPVSTTWNGAYFTIHGGGLWIPDVDADFEFGGSTVSGDFDTDTGFRVGGSVGYDFNQNFGLEAEVSYGQADVDSVTGPAPINTVGLGGDASLLTVMGNAIFGTQYGAWRPYVGVGAGAAMVSLNDISGLPDNADDSDWTWAAQAFVGLDYQLTQNVSVGARYRFQYLGETDFNDDNNDPIALDDFGAHSAEVVLKVGFGG